MLVIDEEEVQHILPSIAYLDQAIQNLDGFHTKIAEQLPRRVNKHDLIEAFTRHGMFRSYTLREAIVGQFKVPRKATAKELASQIPTPSPPKRDANFGKKVAG